MKFARLSLMGLILLLSSFSLQSIASSIVSSIVIQGNERIKTDTIKSFLYLSEGGEYDQALIDKSLKRIFASNLFADVHITKKKNSVVIKVVENPLVNNIYFEGNKQIKDPALKAEISLRPRVVYTKSLLQNDISRIIDVYSHSGRYSVIVEPKIIKLDHNRIDLVFEIDEGPRAKINKIFFIGNHKFSDDKLKSVISSRETRWYSFLTDNDKFNPGRIDYDKQLLGQLYHHKGYADFKVLSATTDLSQEKDKFFVSFTVEEGKKYKISKVSVKSSTKKIKEEELLKSVLTKKGDFFNGNAIQKTVDTLTKIANDKGFAFIDVDPEIKLNKDEATAEIRYVLGEGKRIHINKIDIKGNLRTSEKVIRREFQLDEGDPYNATKLSKAERDLYNLDYFDVVNIKTVKVDESDKVDVNVEVNEKSTASINFAGGYDTTDGAIAKIGFTETNLFGSGKYLSVGITKAKKHRDLDISFTDPYFNDMPFSLGFDLYTLSSTADEKRYHPYSSTSRGGAIRAGREITDSLGYYVRYGYKAHNIFDISEKASSYIKEQKGKHTTSSVGHKLIYNKTDSNIDSTEGYSLSLDQELAGLGGSAKFFKNEVSANFYKSVFGEGVILHLGARAAHIKAFGKKKIRMNERFFLGPDDIRGFEYGGIGPRTMDKQDDKETDNAIGGNIYYIGTAEVKFPLGLQKEMGLFGTLFLDMGTLYKVDSISSQKDIWQAKSIRASAGLSLGFKTPMGPIKLSYGVPIKKAKRDKVRKFNISFTTQF
jgi:outer membrane protein insertion porin family